MSYLEPSVVERIKHRPRYIQTIGDYHSISITRILHEGEEGEPPSKDYDFSWKSIEEHKKEGYKLAKKILEEESSHKTSKGGLKDETRWKS